MEPGTVHKVQHYVGARVLGDLARGCDDEPARHPQTDDERAPGVELNHGVLSPTARRNDPASRYFPRKLYTLWRNNHASESYVGRCDRLTDDGAAQAAHDRFDLGQFGHSSSFYSA
jgi:hypothetical protein